MTKAPWIMKRQPPQVPAEYDFPERRRAWHERDNAQITKARLLLETGSITVDEAEELSAFLQGEDVDVSAILESHSKDTQ